MISGRGQSALNRIHSIPNGLSLSPVRLEKARVSLREIMKGLRFINFPVGGSEGFAENNTKGITTNEFSNKDSRQDFASSETLAGSNEKELRFFSFPAKTQVRALL